MFLRPRLSAPRLPRSVLLQRRTYASRSDPSLVPDFPQKPDLEAPSEEFLAAERRLKGLPEKNEKKESEQVKLTRVAEKEMEEKRKLYNEYLESKASDPPQRPQQRLDVDANHGLWAFFRRLNINGKERYEVIATKEDHTGRAWKASELRRKSFKDLHILWYILLRERNILATQKEEARRLRISPYRRVPRGREATCKRSQARILTVINQRRIAYEEAVKLQHEQTLRETDVSMQPDIDLSPKDKATKPEPLERAERILRRRRSRLHPIVIERANSWRDGAGEVLGRRTSSDSGKKEPPRSVVDNLMVPESVTPPSQSMANQ